QRNRDGTAAVAGPNAPLTRFGGILINGGLSGSVVALGNIFGDILVTGRLTGRIAVHGRTVAGIDPSRYGILGNVTIKGRMGPGGAVVSRGLIGDAASGTTLSFGTAGTVKGIIAAEGIINFGQSSGTPKFASIFNNVGALLNPGDAIDVAAIDAIFTQNGQDLSFDLNQPFDLAGLNVILAHLAALHVDANGNLSL